MGAIVFQLSPLTFSKENVKIMNLCIIFQTFALTRQRKIAPESALTKQFENDINITCELVKWCNPFAKEIPGRLSFINDFGCLGIIYGYVLVPSTIFLLC